MEVLVDAVVVVLEIVRPVGWAWYLAISLERTAPDNTFLKRLPFPCMLAIDWPAAPPGIRCPLDPIGI